MASLWIWPLIITLLPVFALTWLARTGPNRHKKKLPPGPKGLPIFGSLHLLGKLPHRDLHRLSQKHGPIMHMRLGLIHTIIVSSPAAAELFLKTYDHVFASRPLTQVTKHMFYGSKNFGFAPYGSYWRSMRKMCTLELLSSQKVASFRAMRREELGLLVEFLKEAAEKHAVVNLSSRVCCVVRDMTCRMVFGKKYDESELDAGGFEAAVLEVVQLVATPNLGDLIPFVAGLDLQGLNRRAKSVRKKFDAFLDKIVEEHLGCRDENKNKDFVDVMLGLMGSQNNEYKIDRSTIKALILETLITAMDTTSTVIEWAIPELIRHPEVMKKMQEELEKVVGLDRRVEESDLGHLEYFDMVVKEILRLHPPVPLLVPHESVEDCTVSGFHIPKGSRMMVNAWAIGQDHPKIWNDPQKFSPERFIGSHIDLKGKDNFQLIPFGSGRRGCPGIQMGLTMVSLVLAQLVHCFDWKLPNNMSLDELDMTEEFGLTCPRTQHLMVTPIYRLTN